ncbi:unnamed protein product [Cochlearia groenlandica]
MRRLRWNLPRISTIAQAFALTLARSSHLLVPGLLAINCSRKVAFSQRTAPPSPLINRYSSRFSLYKSTVNVPIVVSTLLLSAWEGVVLIGRGLYLAVLLSPNLMMAILEYSCGPRFKKLRLEVLHRTLERAYPAFIKFVTEKRITNLKLIRSKSIIKP